jgi:3-oxoacyl-[acyl-carrier-protein] synthase-3
MPMPSCAVMVQAKLGAKKAFAFDLSAACAGSIYAMSIADQYIQTGKARRALVLGAELLSRVVDWTDRNTCVLFGDASGRWCSVLRGPRPGILGTYLHLTGPPSSPSRAGAASIPPRRRCWRRSSTR